MLKESFNLLGGDHGKRHNKNKERDRKQKPMDGSPSEKSHRNGPDETNVGKREKRCGIGELALPLWRHQEPSQERSRPKNQRNYERPASKYLDGGMSASRSKIVTFEPNQVEADDRYQTNMAVERL